MTTIIDIKDNKEILSYLANKFTHIGWGVSDSILWCIKGKYASSGLFIICYETKRFEGWCFTDSEIDVIETMDEARQLMFFVETNQDLFKEVPTENPHMLIMNDGDKLDPAYYKDLYEAIKKMAENTNTAMITSFQKKSLKEEYYSKYHCGYYLSSMEPADKIGKEIESPKMRFSKVIKTIDLSEAVSKWMADGGHLNSSVDDNF
jgi:hypothetical protein